MSMKIVYIAHRAHAACKTDLYFLIDMSLNILISTNYPKIMLNVKLNRSNILTICTGTS